MYDGNCEHKQQNHSRRFWFDLTLISLMDSIFPDLNLIIGDFLWLIAERVLCVVYLSVTHHCQSCFTIFVFWIITVANWGKKETYWSVVRHVKLLLTNINTSQLGILNLILRKRCDVDQSLIQELEEQSEESVSSNDSDFNSVFFFI